MLDVNENIVFDYESTGQLTIEKDGEQRRVHFEIVAGDSLIYRGAGDRFIVGYRILSLSPDRLVLKKDQHPLFPGPGQEAYEIRQFLPVTRRR